MIKIAILIGNEHKINGKTNAVNRKGISISESVISV